LSNKGSNWIPTLPSEVTSFAACCHIEKDGIDTGDLPPRAMGTIQHGDLFVRLLFNQRSDKVHFHFDFAKPENFVKAPEITSSLDEMRPFVDSVFSLKLHAELVSTFQIDISELSSNHVVAMLSAPSEPPNMTMSEAKFVFNGPVNSLKWSREQDELQLYVESTNESSIEESLFEKGIEANLTFFNTFVGM